MSTLARRQDRGARWRMRYTVVYLAFLYIPVLLLPLFSFNDSIYIAFPIKNWTLRWYADLLDNPAMHAALWNSVKVGVVTAVITTMLGTLAAKALTRYRVPASGTILGAIMLPIIIPSIVIGISLLVLLFQAGIDLGLHAVVMGHVLICLPFSIAVLMSRFEGFDRNLEEASLDLGENGWNTFWRVTFPLVFPGILASVLLTFTISFDEFIIAFFVTSADTTLPVFIWSQLRFPQRLPGVLALGALVITLSFLVVVFAEWVRRRGTQPEKSSIAP